MLISNKLTRGVKKQNTIYLRIYISISCIC